MRCSVCYNRYTEENCPFVLNCGHSFHLECIQRLHGCACGLECPECRTQIKSVNKNFLATSLLRDKSEELSLEELIEKFEEASTIHVNKLKVISDLKKEIKILIDKKDDIVDHYQNQQNILINEGYMKAAKIIEENISKYTDPFKEQIKTISEKKKKKKILNETMF